VGEEYNRKKREELEAGAIPCTLDHPHHGPHRPPKKAGNVLSAKKLKELKAQGLTEDDWFRVEDERIAKALELHKADDAHTAATAPLPRAKPGQGTATAAKRRKEARAKARKAEGEAPGDDEVDRALGEELSKPGRAVTVKGVGKLKRELERRAKKVSGVEQSLISFPDVKREIIDIDYTVYRHVQTQLIFRRKDLEADDPDPLTGENVDEDKELSEEEKVNYIAFKLKGSAKKPGNIEGVAREILRVIQGEEVEGVEVDDEVVRVVQWSASFWTIKDREEAWQGEKGKKGKWQVKFARKGKKGDRESEQAAAAKHEEANGEIRVFIQDRMKKVKGVLVDGPLFESAYGAFYKKILWEVNPDDDEDPDASAPDEEWAGAALQGVSA